MSQQGELKHNSVGTKPKTEQLQKEQQKSKELFIEVMADIISDHIIENILKVDRNDEH
jgi:hypothetical protein